MRNILVIAFCLTGLSAWGGSPKSSAPKARAAAGAAETDERNIVFAEAGTDWKGWLDVNFPDASASWPKDVAKLFLGVVGDEKWSYVGKGNIDRDGAPTGLLIRFKDAPQKGYLIVSRLVVLKWQSGKWAELLKIDSKDGITVNGVKPGAMQSPEFKGYQLDFFAGDPNDRDNPGMWTTVQAVNKIGDALTEAADFYYAPKAKKYGGSAY